MDTLKVLLRVEIILIGLLAYFTTFNIEAVSVFRLRTKVGSLTNISPNEDNGYKYKTLYYKQKVDHFGFTNNGVYLQRYLLNTEHWTAGGPIFFYTGNEGDITMFCNNTGFMWDIAPQFSAMLVFAEHRYYGKSMPYGNFSYKSPKYTNYFTSEQALADYVTLIDYLKSSISGARRSPVVAFGGSYGGMLAAWLRMKYPRSVVGSIAASAPIWMFTGMTDCGAFYHTTTNTFRRASQSCAENIRKTWKTIDRVAQSEAGLKFITETFKLCKPLKKLSDVDKLKGWLQDVCVNLAMVDYPYPANFIMSLPAWPVVKVCAPLSGGVYEGKALLERLFTGISVYFNYTGRAHCLDVNKENNPGLDDNGWDYQTCTEMTTPMCADNVHDMFQPSKWNMTDFSADCYRDWGVRPRVHWTMYEYGGKQIRAASNIVFSNGLLDPWSSLGVKESPSSTLPVVIIAEGAHHLDLRASNKNDPMSVIKAREFEKETILSWINRN